MWVQSLGQEDPLEEDTATHSSFLAWRIPWTEKPDDYSPEGRRESPPHSPGDSQESSPAPQFESINALAFSLLYSQTLTSVYMTTDKYLCILSFHTG